MRVLFPNMVIRRNIRFSGFPIRRARVTQYRESQTYLMRTVSKLFQEIQTSIHRDIRITSEIMEKKTRNVHNLFVSHPISTYYTTPKSYELHLPDVVNRFPKFAELDFYCWCNSDFIWKLRNFDLSFDLDRYLNGAGLFRHPPIDSRSVLIRDPTPKWWNIHHLPFNRHYSSYSLTFI